MKELFTVSNWKRLLTVLTALVLTVGFCFSALPARADGETDGIKDAIYRMLKQKTEETPASSEPEAVEPAVNPSVPAAEENKVEENAQEASTSYLKLKYSGDAYVTDITAQLAPYYPDVKVLSAFHFENLNNTRTVTVYVNHAPQLSNGEHLELVGLNGFQFNPSITISSIGQGQSVMLSFGAIDGFALIVRYAAVQKAEPAKQPVKQEAAPAAEQPVVQPEPVEEPTTEEPEAPAEKPAEEPSEEPVADEPEAPAEEPAEEPSEEPAAEEPEAPAEEPAEEPSEEPAAEEPEVPAEEPAEEPYEEPAVEEPEAPDEEAAEEPIEEPAAEEPEVPAEKPAEEPSEEVVKETVAAPVLSFRSVSADLGDGAVVILTGVMPEGAVLSVRMSGSVVKLINHMVSADQESVNLYTFDAILRMENGEAVEADGLTLTVSGGKVAQALAAGNDLRVLSLANGHNSSAVSAVASNNSVTFPAEVGVIYQINALVARAADETVNEETPAAAVEEEPYVEPADVELEAPVEENTEETQTIVLENNETPIDVREGADGLAAIFTSLPEGAEVTVVQVEGDWVTVIVDGELGYIYIDDIAGYLNLPEEEPAEEAVVEEPAEEAVVEEPVEEASEEPAEEPDEEIVETPKKVTIFTSRRTVMEEGEPVYLTSKLEGFEDCEELLFIWYVDKGNGFEEVEGANEDTYTFIADAESLTWGWQLEVLYR